MIKTYSYIYYYIYTLWKKKKNEVENAKINSVITLTAAISILLLFQPFFIESIVGSKLLDIRILDENKFNVILIAIVVGIFHYVFLATGKRHSLIELEYSNLNSSQVNRIKILAWIYCIIAFVTPVIFFLLIGYLGFSEE